jgi:hypothetical protein
MVGVLLRIAGRLGLPRLSGAHSSVSDEYEYHVLPGIAKSSSRAPKDG